MDGIHGMSLTATRKLFTAATIGNQEIQKVFPPLKLILLSEYLIDETQRKRIIF